MANYGVEVFRGRRWPTQMKISGINAPAETWAVDPALPPLGSDPRYPTSDLIVIPRGRLLSVRPDSHTNSQLQYSDEAYLTIADGVNNKPVGYTESNIFRKWPQRIQIRPLVSKQEFIALPYLTTINDVYGALTPGDKITAYYGAYNSTTPNPMERGRIVKWVGRRGYVQHVGTAANIVVLSEANLSPFAPKVLAAWSATGALVWPEGNAATVSWNSGSGAWQVDLPGNTITASVVLYEWGQGPEQIAGEVVRIQRIDANHLMHGWLQWVTDNFAQWDYPPMAMRVPVTDVTNETNTDLTVIVAGQTYRLKHRPVAFWRPIKVEVKDCVITTESGTTISLDNSTWYELPLADVPYANWTMGKWHSIDPFTGVLSFSGNIVFNNPGQAREDIRVSYSYETSYRDGRLWASGQMGLTDGSGGSGIVGMPAHLDVPGVAGELRVIIY